jgi:hypothetical protein
VSASLLARLKEFWEFLRVRKKFWLLPLCIILALLTGLIVFTPRGPTVYAAFQPGSVSAHGWIDRRWSTALLAHGLDVEWIDATMVKAEGRHILVNGEAKGQFLTILCPRGPGHGACG